MDNKFTRDEPGDRLSTVRASRATPPFVVSKLHQCRTGQSFRDQLETVVIIQQLDHVLNGVQLFGSQPLEFLPLGGLSGATARQFGGRLFVCKENLLCLGDLGLHLLNVDCQCSLANRRLSDGSGQNEKLLRYGFHETLMVGLPDQLLLHEIRQIGAHFVLQLFQDTNKLTTLRRISTATFPLRAKRASMNLSMEKANSFRQNLRAKLL